MEQPLVLVVEDDLLVRISTSDIFEEAGFSVIEAGNVAAALAVLHAQSDVRLVCTDVHMPGDLDGIDLAFHIQRHHPNTKVIVTSGDLKRRGLPPTVPFLPKPYLYEHLVGIAREQLGELA